MGIHTHSDHSAVVVGIDRGMFCSPQLAADVARYALTRAEARRTPLRWAFCRKAQASIKSRPSRSGGGDAPGPADESPVRHSCGPVKIWVRPAGGQAPPTFSQ